MDRSEVEVRYGRLGFWYRLVVVVVQPLLELTTRREWHGQENIPSEGPVIVASNHVSYVDPMTVGLYVLNTGRLPRFLAKASLFEAPLIKYVARGAKQIPVHRGTADASKALTAAVEALAAGECVLIYPEGSATRDPDCWPMRARTGVARLALMSGAPVVPVAQWGPQELWRYRARFPRPFPRKRVQIVAGEPIDLSRYDGADVSADVLREVTELIMARITALLAQLRGDQPPGVAFDPRLAA